jgi:hypothetical protein
VPLPNRQQAPEIDDAAALHPGFIPGSTYVRPPQEAPAGGNLLRLSQSLGELRPALAQLGQGIMAKRQQEADLANQANTLKSDKELIGGYKTPPGFDPAAIANSKLVGQRRAIQLQLDSQTELAQQDVDWRTFDVDKYVTEKSQAYGDMFKADPYATAGYAEGLKNFRTNLMELRTKKAAEVDKGLRQDNTYQGISNAVDAVRSDDSVPDAEKGAEGVRRRPLRSAPTGRP